MSHKMCTTTLGAGAAPVLRLEEGAHQYVLEVRRAALETVEGGRRRNAAELGLRTGTPGEDADLQYGEVGYDNYHSMKPLYTPLLSG